jgi:hypothetical protein
MADIPVKIYRSSQVRPNTSPTNPSFPADQDPVIENPSGTTVTTYKALGDTLDTSFIGKNGFTPIVVNESDLQLIPLTQVQENGLISGGIVQWTGNGYEFNISSAIYRIGGNNFASPASIKTLATPDATNDRIDVFAVDVNNEVVVITGTPASTPIKPQVNPATQLELTSVIVTAASTTPTLTDEVVYDENTEWTGTSSGTGTANFASTTSPYQGTVSIETTNIQDGFTIVLDNGSDFDLGTVQTFGFQIKLKAAMPAGQNILFSLLDASNNPIAKPITIQIDKGITTYQFSGLILSSLGLLTNLVRKVRFGFLRTGGSPTFAGYFLDIVKFEGGINPPVNISNHNSLNGLQGGNATERYHLTKDKAEAAEAANAPTSGNPFATVLDLDDYVPYLGATQDVDLGVQGITTEWVKLNTTPVIPTDQGSMYWDEDDNVLAVVLNGAIQKVGEVTFYNVKNQTGSTIPKGTGVGFAGVVGASGRIKVAPFLADGSQPSFYYVGITAEQILDGEDGKVYNFGPIRGLNTSAFSEGDVLYASSTVAGGFTTTPPTAPNNVIVVAAVLTDSATVGALLVRVTVADLGGGGRDNDAVHYDAADGKTLSERQQAADNTRGMALNTTTVTTSGQINDVSTPTDTLIFTAATDLTGFVPNTTGFLRIVNKNTVNVTIRNNSTLSSAPNRIIGLGSNIQIKPSNFFDLMYDFDQSRWIAMGYPQIKANGADGGVNANSFRGNSSIQTQTIFEIFNSGNTLRFSIRGDGLIVTSGMPTADPGISGALWNDGGTVKIS